MQDDSFFSWLGSALGDVLRTVVDGVRFVFDKLGSATHDFFGGVAQAMGMDASLLNILWIVLGVWMLLTAIRAFARRSIVAGLIWLFLVTILFGMLMTGPPVVGT